jgi:WD40 repeat protein
MKQKEVIFKASIIGYSTEQLIEKDKPKNVTLYNISISTPVNNWKVKHRFNDFYNLHELLSQNYSQLPRPPQKSIFHLTSKSKIEKRRKELETYLCELLKMHLIIHNVYVVQFLRIDHYFADCTVRPPELLMKYETLHSLVFTDLNFLEGRALNYVLCSKGIKKAGSEADSSKDEEGLAVSKCILNGFKYNPEEPTNIFQDKKVLKSFDLKAHCLEYFAEASILVMGFSQGVVAVYKEEKKNKIDDEYLLTPVAKLKAMNDRVTKILINTAKGLMYTVGKKNVIKVVDMATWVVTDSVKVGSNNITSFHIDESTSLGIAATEMGELVVLDLTEDKPAVKKVLPICYPNSVACMDCDIDAGKVICADKDNGDVYLIDIEFPFNAESNFNIISVAKGYVNPTCMQIWRSRKELYVGYVDGTVNIYSLGKQLEFVRFTGSFRMHSGAIHRISIVAEHDYAVSSGYDSCLKIWRPPSEWEKRVLVTPSMVEGVNPLNNLSTIKEEESHLDFESQVPGRRHFEDNI